MSTTDCVMPLAVTRLKADGQPFGKDDKEYWELERNGGIRRYQFFAYPKTVFQAVKSETGRTEIVTKVVASEREHEACDACWKTSPQEATDFLEGLDHDIARAAAEVAAAAERMSEPAKRAYKKRSADSPDHVTE